LRGLRFNSSVGILSVGTQFANDGDQFAAIVSIPQSEFCPLGPALTLCGRSSWQSFNSSVGILSVGTPDAYRDLDQLRPRFNSSVGILSVGTKAAAHTGFDPPVVSIPQSEFCPLGRTGQSRPRNRQERFNSSVGILSVGTWRRRPAAGINSRMFQFLSRNSVRWDLAAHPGIGVAAAGFNSSVGILSVGTPARMLQLLSNALEFQFLSRNSVRWDLYNAVV